MKDFDQLVQTLKDKKDQDIGRGKELEDVKYVVQATDAVQKAVIETAKAIIDTLTTDIQNVRLTNQKESIATPDALKGANTVKQAVDNLKQVLEGKDVDFMPILERLEAVEQAIGKLPTEYPSFPEIPKETAVNNLAEITKCIDDLRADVKKLKLDPKITLKPTDVTVEAPQINVDMSKLEEVKEAIQGMTYPDTSALIVTLINKTVEVTKSIQELEFPIPNFRSGDIIEAIKGNTTALRVEIDNTNPPIVYFGKAEPSASTSESVWQIAKGDTTNGLSKSFPAGDSTFSYVWDDRASLTYN